MSSRGYNKRIEIYETTTVVDGFGGNTVSTTLLATTWAKISTFNVGRNGNATDYGLLGINDTLVIKTRKRNDITYNSQTQFIKYRGDKYIITTSPININFEDREVQFIVKLASNTTLNG